MESVSQNPGEFPRGVRKDIEKIFGESPSITSLDLASSGVMSGGPARDGDRAYLVRGAEGRKGYILETSASGRYEPFDYTVIYQEDLVVLTVRITTYRSSHGAGVCSKNWLKQFRGYRGETLELGDDIDGVSGGTLSAGSLVADIQRCHRLMSELKED